MPNEKINLFVKNKIIEMDIYIKLIINKIDIKLIKQ